MADSGLFRGRRRLAAFASVLVLVTIYLAYPLAGSPRSRYSDQDADFVYPPDPHLAALNATSKRVAVIGAGASGTSAAWFLRRAANVVAGRLGVDPSQVLGDIVVFDRNDYVGGRTTVIYPHGDTGLRPVELGASIFVEANQHLNKAAKRFNLTMTDPDFGESGVGIWDGKQFLFQTSTSTAWWSGVLDTLSAIKRYGPLSPLRTKQAVGKMLTKFKQLYDPVWLGTHSAAVDVEDFTERVGLGKEYTTRNAEEWSMSAIGVNEKWMGEIWEGSTRVNYAIPMDRIHALGASVSMATGGAVQIQGGNYQIFESFLAESGAKRKMGYEVIDIVPESRLDGTNHFKVVTNDSVDNGQFDQIFHAAPWFETPMDLGFPSLQPSVVEPIAHVPYVGLYVTLVGTTRPHANPAFFNLAEGTPIPSTILTSSLAARRTTDGSHPPPKFNSISWHGETYPGSNEWTVKIFSRVFLKDSILRDILGEEPTWIVRKQWDSYPVLKPVTHYPPVEPVPGVQYLAALEPWISTMETQTLSAREAVARVVDKWWGLGYGECKGGAEAWDWSCGP